MLAGRCQIQRLGNKPKHSAWLHTLGSQLWEGDSAVSLGQPAACRIHREWYVCVDRGPVPKEFGEEGLAACGREQVIAAYHLVDSGEGIVHDDREVVGSYAVVASQHDIVNPHGGVAKQHVVHRVPGAVGPEPEGRLSLLPASDPLGLRQISAGAGIAGHAAVRCRCCLRNLTSAAEAFVRPIGQFRQRLLVCSQPL